jgi:hypothetical protein
LGGWKVTDLGALAVWLLLPEPRETGSFDIQIIEPFVSFVIFVVNDIRLFIEVPTGKSEDRDL